MSGNAQYHPIYIFPSPVTVPVTSGFILVLNCPIDEIESVNGIAPSDPKRTYGWTLSKDAMTMTITINTNAGHILTISVKTSQQPKIQKATWTVPNGGADIQVPPEWLKFKGY